MASRKACSWNLLLAWAYLLLSLQEAFQVICVQVVLVVAVGEHQQVQIAPRRHHLVEGTELLKVQRALVVICVSLLQHTAVGQSGTDCQHQFQINKPLLESEALEGNSGWSCLMMLELTELSALPQESSAQL